LDLRRIENMSLSDGQILEGISSGDLVIEPFDRRNLGTDTYDVRLGNFYYREQRHNSRVFNPFDGESVDRTWGVPREAVVLRSVPGLCDSLEGKGWTRDDLVILLEPGETILAHTVEFIGARRGHTTKMFSRSSAGRSMLGVCKCAGRGDVGYFSRWTMEITSFSRYHVIPLKVGMRIAQIEFVAVAGCGGCYGETRGKYQRGSDLDELVRTWRPEMMLPRFCEDWELATSKEAGNDR